MTTRTAAVQTDPKPVTKLCKGSTRMRLFLALEHCGAERSGEAITHREIRCLTGMPERSGSLGNVLLEEVSKRRILVSLGESERNGNQGAGRTQKLYRLSAQGKRDLGRGEIDGNKLAGKRIGIPWTKARRAAESRGAEDE